MTPILSHPSMKRCSSVTSVLRPRVTWREPLETQRSRRRRINTVVDLLGVEDFKGLSREELLETCRRFGVEVREAAPRYRLVEALREHREALAKFHREQSAATRLVLNNVCGVNRLEQKTLRLAKDVEGLAMLGAASPLAELARLQSSQSSQDLLGVRGRFAPRERF